MDAKLQDQLTRLSQTQSDMVRELEAWCAINSGSTNLLGLHKMAEIIGDSFKNIADSCETHHLPPVHAISMTGESIEQDVGPLLLIRKRPELSNRILLAGHMDTVYDINNVFQTCHYRNNNTLVGPGVADMKGGLLVLLQAIKAFEQLRCAATLGWDILINSDEEIGSPASSLFLNTFLSQTIAHPHQAALVFEPSLDAQGTLAKNRKGSGKFTLIATGKKAHAGRAFHEGRNAIAYLAEAVIAIHALNNQREGVTINIGKIAGGDALNVVPDKAVAKLDVRISKTCDEAWVLEHLNRIITQLAKDDYHLELQGAFGRKVKLVDTETESLFKRIQTQGTQLGLNLNWQDTGGCCDGNNIAAHHIPVIDTLGVRGGDIHSPNEYVLLDSLTERSALTLLLLHDLANRPRESCS